MPLLSGLVLECEPLCFWYMGCVPQKQPEGLCLDGGGVKQGDVVGGGVDGYDAGDVEVLATVRELYRVCRYYDLARI